MPTLAEVAVQNPNLSTFVLAAVAGGLVGALRQDGNLTVFAPNNDAFSKVLEKIPNLLQTDTSDVLKKHILPKRLLAKDLIAMMVGGIANEKTLTGDVMEVQLDGKMVKTRVMPNEEWAIVKAPNLLARNGVIHIIDRVM